jgi:hypothetical protein
MSIAQNSALILFSEAPLTVQKPIILFHFRAHSWNVRIKADEVHGPNLDHLLEIPIDINAGVATGDVFVWMDKDDTFPHLRGTVKARDVDFQIWDAPAAFHE